MQYKRNFYLDFSEEQKQFCMKEAGFSKKEKELFVLRAFEDKYLWECAELMGFCEKTIVRLHTKMIKKILNVIDMYYPGIMKGQH